MEPSPTGRPAPSPQPLVTRERLNELLEILEASIAKRRAGERGREAGR